MSEELNAKGQHYKLSSDTTDYNLIAYVSSTGNISIDILTPETLSDNNKKDVALLTDYFTHLPKWTLPPSMYLTAGFFPDVTITFKKKEQHGELRTISRQPCAKESG